MLAEWWCGLKSEFYNAVFHSLVNVRFAFSSQKRGNLCRESYYICFCCSSYESLFHKWTFSKNPVLFIFRGKIFSVLKFDFFGSFHENTKRKTKIHSWMSLAPFYNCTIREMRIAVLHSHHQPYIRGWLSITARSLWIGIYFSSLLAS